MTTGVVTFDVATFLGRYPEFAQLNTSQPQALGLCFGEATLYLDNSTNSRVQQVEQRAPLLYMLTAHIAALYYGVNGQAPSSAVGRMDSATEGSVTVSLDMSTVTFDAAWFMQTKYGASFWQATAKFRMMRYVAGRSVNAPNVSPPWGWGGAPPGGWSG